MSAEPQDSYDAAAHSKFSRYRSVRTTAGRTAPELNPAQVGGRNVMQDGGLKKSPSRYRRTPGKSAHDQVNTPAIPPLSRAATAPITISPRKDSRTNGARVEGTENVQHKSEPLAGETRSKRAQRDDLERRAPLEELEAAFKEQGRRHAQALESAREVGFDKARRVREGEGIQRARTVPLVRQMSDEDAAEILEIQKQKDLERLDRELSAASSNPPKCESPAKEKFHLFPRKRAISKESPPFSPPIFSRTSSNTLPEPNKKRQQTAPEKAQHIEVGGGGIVPGTDAPISAVNSGERRVLVRCKQSSINLPVTPTTTSTEIINSVANILTQNIDPAKAILLESYAQLGLERGIRKYENIRDVMNSWDRDTQNALLIETSPTSLPTSSPLSNPAYLDPDYVSREVPMDTSVYLYHSQKPGRWNKRHVTLLSTGQIYISKNPESKISDKESTAICHLSDFDIFIPTSSQVRKNLKPPKKICYAVKSQQKTSFFESTENFVHFFSTDDEKLARKWWSAVQKWRSWYLLHKSGRTNKDAGAVAKDSALKDASAKDSMHRSTTRGGKEGKTAPHAIGSFEPLLGTADFSGAGHTGRRSRTINTPNDMNDEGDQIPFLNCNTGNAPKPLSRSKYPPVSSAISKIRSNNSSADDETSGNTSSASADQPFAPKGLLGRSYTVKQKAIQEKEKGDKNSGPFVEGNNLLNAAATNTGSAGLSRRISTRRNSIDGTSLTSAADMTERERPKTSSHTTNHNMNRSNTMRTTHRSTTTSSERTRTMTGNTSSNTAVGSGNANGNGNNGKIPPLPLVDLTPKVLEAKQWSKEGKGRGVKAPEGMPLVEIARSRDLEEGGDGGGWVKKVVVPRSYEPRIGGRVG